MDKKIILLAILLLLGSLFVVNGQYDPKVGLQDSVWLLKGDRHVHLGDDYFGGTADHGIVAVVIIPEPVRSEVVSAAWSYAIRYGADGLDLPNYERAVEIMMERHPTWIAATTKGYTVSYSADRVDLDVPELTPEATVETTPSS